MSDPISLTGTAVGVVSLGIQVCQGLYTYANTARGRDQDLNTASTKISALRRSFQDLEHLIPSIQSLSNPNHEAIKTLEKCLRDSEQGVRQLDTLLTSLKDIPDSGPKAKVKNAGRVLAFGFQQKDLFQMQESVDSLLNISQTALQVVNSHLGLSLHQELVVCKTSLDSRQIKMSQQLQIIEQNLENAGDHLEHTHSLIENKSDAILKNINSVNQDLRDSTSAIVVQSNRSDARHDNLQRLMIEQHKQTQDQVSQVLALLQAQRDVSFPSDALKLISKPALLKEVCDSVNYAHEEQAIIQTVIPLRCTCDIRKERIEQFVHKSFYSKYFGIYNKQRKSSRHSRHCHYYIPEQSRCVGAQFMFPLRTGLSILLDMSLSHTGGAGGFSISPQLALKQVVKDSPAMLLIEQISLDWDISMTSQSLKEFCDLKFPFLEREILKLFQEGKASPQDVTAEGQTLLHILFRELFLYFTLMFEIDITQMCRLVKTLIGFGVPCDERDTNGTFLDYIFLLHFYAWPKSRQSSRALLANLSQVFNADPLVNIHMYGCNISCLLIENNDAVECKSTIFHSLGFLVIIRCPAIDMHPLMAAIMLQSEARVGEILNKSPEALFGRYYGMTVLHLVSSWPAGLSLLLKAGAVTLVNQPYNGRDTPVVFAWLLQSPEAMQVLFNHGAAWNYDDIGYRRSSPECVRCLAFHLFDQRRSLCSIAKKVLAKNDLEYLGISRDTIIDTEAPLVLQKILEIGERVPEILHVPNGYEGMYFSLWLTLDDLRVIFDAGFHQINERNSKGLLPIHVVDPGSLSSDVLIWLQNHSCLDQSPTDPQCIGLNTSATGWHYLAFKFILYSLSLPFGDPRRSRGLSQNFISTVLNSRSRDCCSCWCSSDGCPPLDKMLVSISGIYGYISDLHYERIGQILERCLPEHSNNDFLRFITFQALEMTHTCCIVDTAVMSGLGIEKPVLKHFPGSPHEIRVDESELGARLESLVGEFEAQYAKSERSLMDFIHSYWAPRMAKECIPLQDNLDELRCLEINININEEYETPLSLQRILGRNFQLQDYLCP